MRAIMTMIGGTRHDCVLGSTAVMRLGTAEAIHWAAHRQAFGRRLADHGAMQAVLADLALESEAATAGALRLARANEQAQGGDAGAERLRRIAAPVLKYWTCKRAPAHAAEALECQGGFGYIEESRLARAYREAPLMSVWEGSGNVQALDVLRAAGGDDATIEALRLELDEARGGDPRLDAAIDAISLDGDDEPGARRLTGQLARCIQGSLLVRHAPAAVADAFCATRLGEGTGERNLGELPAGLDLGRSLSAPRRRAPRSREGRRGPAARRARRGRAQPAPPRGPDRAGGARALAAGDLPAGEHDDAEPLPPQHARGGTRHRGLADADAAPCRARARLPRGRRLHRRARRRHAGHLRAGRAGRDHTPA